ncbi:MAG: sulfate transporter CysZ [Pseudomonadales bacterium]
MTLLDGARLFLAGARAVREPGMGRYTWPPLLVSAAIVISGLGVAFSRIDDLVVWVSAQLPGWLDFLTLILEPLLYLLGMLMGAWLFAFVAVLVGSPFLGMLSAAVERRHGEPSAPAPAGFWAALAGTFARELRKLGYHLPRLLAVLLLSLLPVINTVAPLIWFLFGAWTLAVEFADYPAENRARPFRETLTLLRQHRAAAMGYGVCATAALSIPLVNFLFVPAVCAGGTLLWLRIRDEG